MDALKKAGFGTQSIHAGSVRDAAFGSLIAPIYQTSTFVFENCEQGGRRFAGEEEGFIYSRLGNPTVMQLEDKLAVLEGAQAGAATSSGMGAIASVFWTLCRAGSHIVADKTLYGCTYALLSHGLARYGVDVSFVDCADPGQIRSALRPETVAVYVETPANPSLKIVDLAMCANIAHGYDPKIMCVCDNTFATPYLQRPLELGFDVAVYSLTKYQNGHGDVIAGAVLGCREFIKDVKLFGIKDMTGSVLGPHEAYLILRGLKTFEIRMQRHCRSAGKVARFLRGHPKVERVYYPGFEDHPGHAVAARQMSDFGGIIAFEVRGGRAAGVRLLDNLKLCALAVSLGDAETLIEHPASMTHSPYTAEELAAAGIPEGLVRLSVGLENPEDIVEDLENGLQMV